MLRRYWQWPESVSRTPIAPVQQKDADEGPTQPNSNEMYVPRLYKDATLLNKKDRCAESMLLAKDEEVKANWNLYLN